MPTSKITTAATQTELISTPTAAQTELISTPNVNTIIPTSKITTAATQTELISTPNVNTITPTSKITTAAAQTELISTPNLSTFTSIYTTSVVATSPELTNTPNTANNITSDPCSLNSVLDNDWRRTESRFYTNYSNDDTLVEWSGWYRLNLQGKSAQIPESDWCWSFMSCGGYTALLLGGSHPQLQDGIVTRDIYGTSVDSRRCNSYRSNSIQVKACPENYYVYRLVKPAGSLPIPTYCAVAMETPSYDPCNNYTSLDQPWRATNETGGYNCDRNFNWTGWYRLLYNGMNIRMPDSCVNIVRCGTFFTLWLNGSHPQIEDGIVTRRVCVSFGREDCCYFRSTPIRVKACPGNYYVYEFVRPFICTAAYCADVNTIMSVSTTTAAISTELTTTPITFNDPCYNYTALDQTWRATNATGLNICDRYFNWNGWYRLLYYGMSVRMPDSCVNQSRCGTNISLWLNGFHPQIKDGIVTRGVCGGSGSDCCYYRSTPIRVKACPGNYYVYEFGKPNVCDAAYCADTANSMTSDPCSVYSVLDDEWRRTKLHDYNNYYGYDDTLLEWSGWYHLKLQGTSAQIPESDLCWSYMSCGGYTALLLGGSHPRLQDGIVTREIYGTSVYSNDSRQCNSYRSNPIQVKACPGNYYVYRLVKPALSIPMPTYCAVVFNDPCYNYTALDQPWRATNAAGLRICDSNFNWNGWYRLLYYGMSIRMPESCQTLQTTSRLTPAVSTVFLIMTGEEQKVDSTPATVALMTLLLNGVAGIV
ncbi:uncharacterized protein LOC118801323 [Colossoma macropomum]|uniref:uncharacterized protein LOC118801323 n=1 Tax=Colossoma macropomum TaxID=42526 RepID=UPI001864810C|nr:uncharacterized protein LOC118801323 [Colossoma macropomum]